MCEWMDPHRRHVRWFGRGVCVQAWRGYMRSCVDGRLAVDSVLAAVMEIELLQFILDAM